MNENQTKKILGLDIGTNSVGGAFLHINEFGKDGTIEWLGSRIIPLDGDSLSKFENGGQIQTKAANRTMLRGSRKLKQRYKLRRSRLIKVFKLLKWVSNDFPDNFKEQSKNNLTFNINNYLAISNTTKQEAYKEFGTEHISDDWIVYFLRKKALEESITLQELARILYMLNQRRGFKSSRKEVKQEEETELKWPKIEKWVEILQVTQLSELSKEKDKTTYRVRAGNYEAEIIRRNKPDWEGKQMELEITRKTTKSGEQSYSFKMPDISDWEKQKTALHKDVAICIDNGICRTIGEYFYIQLQNDKNYRIRQRIVERELYKNELELIWAKQLEFHPELNDRNILPTIAKIFYQHNQEKQKEIASHDLLYLFANDIIYYQRPLKSQKHSIDVCRFEKKEYVKDGETISIGIKVAPKSSPEFQEFRIWQDIHNLRIYERFKIINDRQQIDVDVTNDFITADVKALLFNLFDSSIEVSSHAIYKVIDKKLSDNTHKINLFATRDKLKGNETKAVFRKVFKKHNYEDGEKLLQDPESFYKLWHILYSLNEEKDLAIAFKGLKKSNGEAANMPDSVVLHLAKQPELTKQYSAYSSKAIKKMLPLMRVGGYWNALDINSQAKQRIDKIIDGEFDDNIDDRTRDIIQRYNLKKIEDFSGLPVWLCTYVIYNKHAERATDEKYTHHDQILPAKLIPANSLRNPFVEQIIRETLQIVKDVWAMYGQPDEIHIELARELKKTAEEKSEISKANTKNLAEKERIKKLLKEFRQGNPESSTDIEKFRLWKSNGGTESNNRFDELFNKKNEFISSSDVEKYRLWADQNHLSPYTGKPIPLSSLFNKAAYEIEHIFPRSRFFDDSFANKVICETGVNKEKDNTIARLFIQQYNGKSFERGGQTHTLLNEEEYVSHCKRIFHGKKLRNLLAESIPNDFVSRQLNDTRYITKKLAELLYPIAKDKEGIIYTGGNITNELKDKWGLNKVWKELLIPRFERLSVITAEPLIIRDNNDVNKFHFAKEIKRIDHRHHALDALIIAATTKEHIRYLNTLNATENEKKKNVQLKLVKAGIRDFVQPWPKFTQEAKEKLNEIIVSHKSTNRIVTKPFNKYLKWKEEDGKYIKKLVLQCQPKDLDKTWTAVRRSMFKEPQGVIYLKSIVEKKINDAISIQIEKQNSVNRKGQKPYDYIYDQEIRPIIKNLIKQFNSNYISIKEHLKKNPIKDIHGNIVDKVRIAHFAEYAAKRVTLDGTFDEKKIAKIPYSNHLPSKGKQKTLAQILKEHLQEFKSSKLAFAGEGLEVLQKKVGYPLKKVTIYEKTGSKIPFKGKLYETDKGGNVFFVIRQGANGERKMETLPLMDTIERLANKLPLVDEEDGYKHIILSPNELVYVPEEGENIKAIDWNDKGKLFSKIYKMVSCTGSVCYFLPHNVANLLLPYSSSTKKGEFGSLNKSENTIDNTISIKKSCIKLKIDRLGNIRPA